MYTSQHCFPLKMTKWKVRLTGATAHTIPEGQASFRLCTRKRLFIYPLQITFSPQGLTRFRLSFQCQDLGLPQGL